MKRIATFGLLFFLLSCQNNKVLLPIANETIVAEAKEHNPIYFFFRIEKKDTLIDIKESNSVDLVNRVFNIDRRLPLRKVILEIKKMQVKKTISATYFAYNDTTKKAVAFLPINKIKYKLEKPDFNEVYFYLDRNDLVHFSDEVFSKNELQPFLDKKAFPPSRVVFAYDKGMSFGKYIQYQFFLKHLVAPKGITFNNNKEYIY